LFTYIDIWLLTAWRFTKRTWRDAWIS